MEREEANPRKRASASVRARRPQHAGPSDTDAYMAVMEYLDSRRESNDPLAAWLVLLTQDSRLQRGPANR